MERLKQTLYDVLGVSRDARNTDIGRAYNRLRAEMRSEAAVPDPRREALMHEAYEVLSDPQKRAAYDASLRRGFARRNVGETRSRAPLLVGAVAALGAIGAALYAINRPSTPTSEGKPAAEIQAAASLAVGRVQSIDLSGKAANVGVAFTIDEGVMILPCAGLAPTAQIVVLVPPRSIPARIVAYDPRGFCRLALDGGGSWPLRLAGAAPRAGDKVYAANLTTHGEVALREGHVTKVLAAGEPAVVETDIPVLEGMSGRPLLDTDGRVVAIAMLDANGKGRHVAVSERWLRAAPPSSPPPEVPR